MISGFIIYSISHPFLQIAITGKSFFRASAIATDLVKNNILRIGHVNVIGDVILFLGKLCVSLSSAVFAFLMLDTHKYKSAHNKLSSPLLPVVVCFLYNLIERVVVGDHLRFNHIIKHGNFNYHLAG